MNCHNRKEFMSALSFLSEKIRVLSRVTSVFFVLCLTMMVPAHVALAAQSNTVRTDHTVATLITASDAADEQSPLHVALRLQLSPGWHTYWLNPGDAGEAVTTEVTAQGALQGKSSTIIWPVPLRIPDSSLMSYAYTGDVVLPLSLTLRKGDAVQNRVEVKAHADWLVCASLCVPESGDFTLTLPVGTPAPSAQAPLFEAAAQNTPVPSPFTATMTPQGLLKISGGQFSERSVKEAWFMPDQPGLINQPAEQKLRVENGDVLLQLTLLPEFKGHRSLSGVLVLKDADGAQRALTQAITVSEAPAVTPSAVAAHTGLLKEIAFALLGGLILNLMPCVFPVLAMKALSVAKMGHGQRHAQIGSAACYAAGVMVSFLALGGLIMSLRVAGSAAGWGFQFQSTVFVTAMTWLLFVMSLNLLGVFEFLPVSAGSGLNAHKHGYMHDVLTGVLATVVASPCTAPFMGVAIAGALSGPPLAGLSVFAAMGLGLAAPYLLLVLVPGLASKMPKPGPWMQYLRQFLAFPLLATCVWLVWVATLQGGAQSVLMLASGLVMLAFSAWLYGVAQVRFIQRGMTHGLYGVYGLAIVVFVGALSLLPILAQSSGNVSQARASGLPEGVEAFTQARFDELKAQGKPVFVDMSAAWCITCLVNERIALDIPATRAAFAKYGVTVLRGDWTNHNPAISAFLSAHGRDGVPLYVYSPAHGPEVTLPQILTPALILKTLEQ